ESTGAEFATVLEPSDDLAVCDRLGGGLRRGPQRVVPDGGESPALGEAGHVASGQSGGPQVDVPEPVGPFGRGVATDENVVGVQGCANGVTVVGGCREHPEPF